MMHHCIIKRKHGIRIALMHKARDIIAACIGSGKKFPSQRALASAAGLDQSLLSRFLRGRTEVLEFHHLQSVAHALGMTVSQAIGEEPLVNDPKVLVVARLMMEMPEYKKDAIVAATTALAKPDPSQDSKAE
jgi:transcriptional regulator with XRE-family HTH domain